MHSECSKVSIYQPKNQHFLIINQQEAKEMQKWRFYVFTSNITSGRKDISCNASGGGGGVAEYFLLKRCNTAHSECSQLCSTILSRIFHDSKNNLPYQSSIQSRLAC